MIDRIIESFWNVLLHPEEHPRLIVWTLIAVMTLAIVVTLLRP